MPFGLLADAFVKDALVAVMSHPSNALKVKLYTNNLAPGRGNVLADFVEASYPGYSQFSWPYTPITVDGSHRGVVVPALATFTAPTSGGAVTVYGWIFTWVGTTVGVPLYGGGALFLGGPKTLNVGDPSLTFGVALRDFDAH